MSATEELRKLLDERGVKYFRHEDGEPLRELKEAGEPATSWFIGSANVCAVPNKDGELFDLWIDHCTAEQAIVATVGETCHTVAMDCFGNPPWNQSGLHGNDTTCGCSECGAPWGKLSIFRGNAMEHNFVACPICGRRVVEWPLPSD